MKTGNIMEEYVWIQALLTAESKNVHIDLNNVIAAVMGAGAGVYWFFKGFKDLQNKRKIENIPTSQIATGAVGSDVEIKGQLIVHNDSLLTAPVSNKKCAFYILNISKLESGGNSQKWKAIDTVYSDDGFFLEDGSGANAMVQPKGAKILHKKGNHSGYQVNKHNWQRLPSSLKQALDRDQGQIKNFRFEESYFSKGQVYSFSEQRFEPGEKLYVLGFAESGLHLSPPDKEPTVPTKMILKKQEPHTFLISNKKEEDLVKGLIWVTRLKVFGGPVLTVACTLYLISIYGDLIGFFKRFFG